MGTGASGAPGAGASSAGGAVSCSSFADAAGWSLRVRIRNEMSSTLYVGQENSTCDVDLLFQVEDGARQKLPRLNGCPSSCQTAMASGAVLCPDSCALPSTVTLEPGQSIELPWDGRFAVEHLLPPQCLRPELQSPANCVRAEQVEAGPYHFLARAGTGRHCLSGTCGACTPNPNGGCTTPGSLITGTIITTERFVGLEPGELSPSGTPPLLLLVFEKLG